MPWSVSTSLIRRLLARKVAVGCVVALLALLAAADVEASRTIYLARNEALCATGGHACIKGTLSYDTNSRLLTLRGRVQFAPGPGEFRITVKGSNRLGHVAFAPMEIKVRGKPTEIVDFKMIPDHPDVENWQIDHIEFVLATDLNRGTRAAPD